jgi:hypothetical protein
MERKAAIDARSAGAQRVFMGRFVPAHLPHVEVNPSPDEPMEVILARGPDNIVVNLPDAVDHLTERAMATSTGG